MRDSKTKYRQKRQEERRDRIVESLEKGADAAVRGSEALVVWLFSPDRPTHLGRYLRLWGKLVAVFVTGFAVLGEYAHWRAPDYYGAKTIGANPEFLQLLIDTTESFMLITGFLIGLAWIIHQASLKDARDKEMQADRLRQEHDQAD